MTQKHTKKQTLECTYIYTYLRINADYFCNLTRLMLGVLHVSLYHGTFLYIGIYIY